MSPERACPAKSRPARRFSGVAKPALGSYGLTLVIAALAAGMCQPAVASGADALPDTDNPTWRAQHGVLLGLAHAGKTVVAVGNAGNVLLSDDDGLSWRLAKSPTDELLTAVVFPTPEEGWAVGQDETVLHSTDAGRSWTQQNIKPAADQALFTIISLSPANAPPTHLFASGSYDLILETQDGKSWAENKIPNLDDDYHLNCAVNRGDDILVTGEGGHAFIRYAGAWMAMKLPYDGSAIRLPGRAGWQLLQFRPARHRLPRPAGRKRLDQARKRHGALLLRRHQRWPMERWPWSAATGLSSCWTRPPGK